MQFNQSDEHDFLVWKTYFKPTFFHYIATCYFEHEITF